jgi:PAS domain-containing protein
MELKKNITAEQHQINELSEKLEQISKQLAEATNESNENKIWLNTVLGISNMIIWDVNYKNNEIYVSENYARLTGNKQSELKTIKQLLKFRLKTVFPEDKNRLVTILKKISSNQLDNYQLEYRILTHGKYILWINERTQVISRDENGRIERLSGVIRITDEQKKLQEVLGENEEKYKFLFENMLNGFLLFEIIDEFDDFSNKFF